MATLTKSFGNFKDYASRLTAKISRIGKALLFPIAAMPIAAILLRIGAAVPTDTAFAKGVADFVSGSGGFFFDNLPIIFAIGVAFGFAKDNRGEAALVGGLMMLLMTFLLRANNGFDLTDKIYGKVDLGVSAKADPGVTTGFHAIIYRAYDSIMANNVLTGFAVGGFTAYIYNHFSGVQLPKALSFFSGRRLVPVLVTLATMIFAIIYAIIWPWIAYAIYKFSEALADAQSNRYSNSAIMGVYGFLNRLLIPFGLHHIPNTLFWFALPTSSVDANGAQVTGDIFAFLNGVPQGNTAGTFQSGFFPVMMFGLPALVAAFWYTADNKEQRTRVIALFGSAAIISFLTGITEPIEFAFLFIAPGLFITHALLTGLFGFITGLFGIQIGFGFSAGAIDYGLSIPKSLSIISANKSGVDAVMANPGWIWVIGGICAATYFTVATMIIKKMNLQTPGRGTGQITLAAAGAEGSATTTTSRGHGSSTGSPRATAYVKALGGYGNITNYQNCTTRLRYDVVDSKKIDESALKAAGAKGVVKVGTHHVQIVVGLDVEKLNDEIKAGRPN